MDYAITKQEYEQMRTLLYDESGISLGVSKQSLVVSRLTKRLRDLHMEDFSSYYEYVTRDQSGEEFTRMLEVSCPRTRPTFFVNPNISTFCESALAPIRLRLHAWMVGGRSRSIAP